MKIVKWIALAVATLVLNYFGTKFLENIYLEANIKSWFYVSFYKALSFKVNLLLLLVSIVVVWLFYELIIYLININKKFRVIKATYGTDNIRKDFTKKLNDSIVDGSIYIYLTNGFVGEDPVHGVQKKARIKYKLNDRVIDIEVIEGNLIQIPPAPERNPAILPS